MTLITLVDHFVIARRSGAAASDQIIGPIATEPIMAAMALSFPIRFVLFP
jgi:hypothetical protein